MLSLKERLKLLEEDLKAVPPRIKLHNNLPFAIVRYEPEKEWLLYGKLKKLATRLLETGKEVVEISLGDLLWEAVEKSEGLDAIVELEREFGFPDAQDQVNVYLSDPDWCPLADLLAEKLNKLDHEKNMVFLTRASAMAPAIYPMSRLLDEMQGRTEVITILFYPGTIEGATGLRFMVLKDRDSMGNYRVKIYN